MVKTKMLRQPSVEILCGHPLNHSPSYS